MAKHIFKGSGAPSFAPKQVGHHYVDTLSSSQYISSGTSSPSDWTLLTAGIRPENTLRVVKNSTLGQNDFNSINDALDSISTNSDTNPFVIQVYPGIYVEDTIIGKPYVSIVGENKDSVIIVVDDPDKHVIEGSNNFTVKNVTLRGATGFGKFAVYYNPTTPNGSVYLEQIYFGNNDGFIGVYVDTANSGSVLAYSLTAENGTNPTTALRTESTTGDLAILLVEGFTGAFFSSVPDTALATGTGALLVLTNVNCQGISGGRFVRVTDGARLVGRQIAAQFYTTAFESENVGAAPTIQVTGAIISTTTNDILISHPGTTGALQGLADSSKVTVNASSSFKLNYLDATTPDVGEVTLGDIFQGDRHDRILSLSRVIRETAPVGVYSGGIITATTGLGISVSAGVGFTQDSVDNYLKEVSWDTTPLTLTADAINYIYITSSGVVSFSASEPNVLQNLIVGRVLTHTSDIEFIDKSSIRNNQLSTRIEDYQREAIGPIFSRGSTVVENGTRGLDVASGVYYFGNTKFSPSGGTPISWEAHYRDGIGGYVDVGAQSTISNSQYDNNSGSLVSLTSGYYAKHSLYVGGDGADESYFLVYSQAEYSSLILAEAADIPLPPSRFADGIVLIASIIVQQGATNLEQIRDERPIIGFKASGVSAASFHGNLLGLGADDHTQYLLVNGSRAMSGSLNMGSQTIINSGTINGIDIAAHGSRHLPNGSDALTTAAPPSNLTATTTNAVGTANSLSRSDHSHAITTATASTISTSSTNTAGTSASLSRADHTHQVNLTYGETSATANTTTTSGTDVLISGMTLTPVAGIYKVWFSTTLESNSTNSLISVTIYSGGSASAHSLREAVPQFSSGGLGGTPSLSVPLSTQCLVSVNGSQAIEARWRRTGGTATAKERTLNILKVG